MMKIINLTGHDVVVKNKTMDTAIVIPSHGKLRARYTTKNLGQIKTEHGSIPLTQNFYHRIINMPESYDGVYYLVSRLVAELYPERNDLLITNGLIKENGNTVACRSLSKI
jgi:hypothetical protein